MRLLFVAIIDNELLNEETDTKKTKRRMERGATARDSEAKPRKWLPLELLLEGDILDYFG